MATRVYVGHIPYEARERDIERFFKGYGRIREILLKRGFAFVELGDPRDADDAVYELNGRSMLGMRVIVEIAKGRPNRYESRRRSRSYSYGRRRSRSRTRSGSRGRRRSRSGSRRRSASGKRSASDRDSRSRSPIKRSSRSASIKRSPHSRSRSASPAARRSVSRSPPRHDSASPHQNGRNMKVESRSRSRSASRSRSRSAD